MQRGTARFIVQSSVFEHDVGRAQQFARADAPARTLFAAHLEQIGEVIVEQQRQIETRRAVAMVLHADPLVRRSAPQEEGAHDVQHVLLQHDPAIAIDVRVGEIDRQCRIVVAHVRAEQQRLDLVQHEFQSGEIAGVGVEQSIRPAGGSADVAMAVEYDEGVIMLERTPRPCRGPGHRNVERRFLDLFDDPGGHDLGNDFGCHVTSIGSPASPSVYATRMDRLAVIRPRLGL